MPHEKCTDMEDKLKISDEMFLELGRLCNDNFIIAVTKGLNIETSSEDIFEAFNYFDNSFSEARNIDKINFAMCFLEKGGKYSRLFYVRQLPP